MEAKRIVLGSISRIKDDALGRALRQLRCGLGYTCLGVRTKLPPQPIGFEQTLLGAFRRAEYAKKDDCGTGMQQETLYIGIENGLIPLPGVQAIGNAEHHWAVDLAVIYVLPGDGSTPRMTTSLGVSIPPEVAAGAFKMQCMAGLTVGELLAQRVDCDPNDPHKSLCGISRVDILADALCAALKPILSPKGQA